MAERRKTNSSNITSFGNSQVQRIHSDIHRIMDSREYDFYELEPVEVKEVLLDKNKRFKIAFMVWLCLSIVPISQCVVGAQNS